MTCCVYKLDVKSCSALMGGQHDYFLLLGSFNLYQIKLILPFFNNKFFRQYYMFRKYQLYMQKRLIGKVLFCYFCYFKQGSPKDGYIPRRCFLRTKLYTTTGQDWQNRKYKLFDW